MLSVGTRSFKVILEIGMHYNQLSISSEPLFSVGLMMHVEVHLKKSAVYFNTICSILIQKYFIIGVFMLCLFHLFKPFICTKNPFRRFLQSLVFI